MKGCGVSARWALAIVGCLALLTGCGGGGNSGGGGGGNQAPTITSFSAGAGEILSGSSTTLTAVFTGGTGVVTPGNLSITSGTAITVSPTSTTTYTLTVSGSGGTASQAATVKVDPAPVITSFSAGANEILAGTSTSLTAVFSGGTGVITAAGGYSVTVISGTPVTVNPTSTTTYTLTVTPPVGSAITQTVKITVDPAPVITSFTASTNPIDSGSSTDLTAIFSGGTGVITPGNLAVTSGTPVTVSPTATTTYTLTVTPPVGSAITKTLIVTVNVNLISSFSANPNFIASGKTSSLIPVFSGGTGVITAPGGFSQNVTSGGSFPVSPTATTTYTLTVTPTGGGTPSTATVTVNVYAITSFSASPNPITAGSSTQLTAVFANGTGVITGPGGFSTNVTSGTPVSVTPNPPVTTTYTLTVTPLQGSGTPITQTVTVSVNPLVTVDQGTLGAKVTNQILGMNLAMWYDVVSNSSAIVNAFKTAGIAAVRWPGGSSSDIYHWNGTAVYPATAAPSNCNGGYSVPSATFANFLSDIVTPANLDLAVTADYGSNPTCNGGGLPSEAAGWAAAAVADGVPIHYMTVGNESYGSWEYDLHAVKHDPTTYAAAVAGSNGYYSLIKAQSPTTQVGVVVDPNVSGWDSTVLANAKGYYDFVEYHYYPQDPGNENDTNLVQQAAQTLTANIKKLETELQTAGEPNTPIYVGEIGSVSGNPGKQTWSITQGLYAGQVLGEFLNDGIARATWWIGFGNCNGTDGNLSTSLYGWQNFGAYNVFSDGPGDTGGKNGGACSYGSPIGAMSPTAQAFNLFQNVAVNGEHVYTATVNGDTTNIRAYAATHSGGTALVLFNLNQTAAENVVVDLSGQTNSSSVQVMTYDKEMYDYTNTACALDPTCTYDPNHDYSTAQWVGPATTTLSGAQTFPLTLTLQPWSINVVLVK